MLEAGLVCRHMPLPWRGDSFWREVVVATLGRISQPLPDGYFISIPHQGPSSLTSSMILSVYWNADRGVKAPHPLAVACGYTSLEDNTQMPSGTRQVSKMGVRVRPESTRIKSNPHLHIHIHTPAALCWPNKGLLLTSFPGATNLWSLLSCGNNAPGTNSDLNFPRESPGFLTPSWSRTNWGLK